MPECQPDHYIRTTQEINSGNIEAIILSPTFADKVAAKRAKKKKCRIKEREIKEIKKSALCCFGTLYRTRGCFWNHAYLYKAAVINEDCECYWFAGAYTLFCRACCRNTDSEKRLKLRSGQIFEVGCECSVYFCFFCSVAWTVSASQWVFWVYESCAVYLSCPSSSFSVRQEHTVENRLSCLC